MHERALERSLLDTLAKNELQASPQMGNSESRVRFQAAVLALQDRDVGHEEHTFWEELWRLPQDAEVRGTEGSDVVARPVAHRVAVSRCGAGGFRLRDPRRNPIAQRVPSGQSGDVDSPGGWSQWIAGRPLTAGPSRRHARPCPKWSTSSAIPSRSISARRSTVYAARVHPEAQTPSTPALALTAPRFAAPGARSDPDHAIPAVRERGGGLICP